MKTINYQLSSQKCLEEGWTVRPPSPLTADEGDDAFIPEPLNIDLIRSGRVRIGAEIYCGLHMPVCNACVKLWNYKNENTEILSECTSYNSQLYENEHMQGVLSWDFIRIYCTVLLYYFGGENGNVFYTCHFFQLGLVEKFYESGQKFLTMFPDGTGNILYPFLYLNYSVI